MFPFTYLTLPTLYGINVNFFFFLLTVIVIISVVAYLTYTFNIDFISVYITYVMFQLTSMCSTSSRKLLAEY